MSEFCSRRFTDFLHVDGIKDEFTVPYTPKQNAISECDNRTIMEAVQSMIYYAKLNPAFWAEAVDNVIFSLNRTCSRLIPHLTPFEAYTGTKPSLAHMRLFGCKVYIHVPHHLRKKLDPKSRSGIFLGYFDASKGYRIWDLQCQRVVISRDVLFDEHNYTQEISSSEISSSIVASIEVPFSKSEHNQLHESDHPVNTTLSESVSHSTNLSHLIKRICYPLKNMEDLPIHLDNASSGSRLSLAKDAIPHVVDLASNPIDQEQSLASCASTIKETVLFIRILVLSIHNDNNDHFHSLDTQLRIDITHLRTPS